MPIAGTGHPGDIRGAIVGYHEHVGLVGDAELWRHGQAGPRWCRTGRGDAERSVPVAGSSHPGHHRRTAVGHHEHVGLVADPELIRRPEGGSRQRKPRRGDTERSVPVAGSGDPEDLDGAVVAHHEHVGLVGYTELWRRREVSASRSEARPADRQRPLPRARSVDPTHLDGAVAGDSEHVGLVGYPELRGRHDGRPDRRGRRGNADLAELRGPVGAWTDAAVTASELRCHPHGGRVGGIDRCSGVVTPPPWRSLEGQTVVAGTALEPVDPGRGRAASTERQNESARIDTGGVREAEGDVEVLALVQGHTGVVQVGAGGTLVEVLGH